METSIGYQTYFTVKDTHFDVELIPHYHLQIILGSRDIVVNVLDVEKEKIVFFELIQLPPYQDSEQFVGLLQEVWQSHPYLLAGFWGKVKLSLFSTQFSLLPEKFHNKNAVEQYYTIGNSFEPNSQELHFAEVSKRKVYIYFAVDNYLIAWIKNIYQNSSIAITHYNSNLLLSASNLSQYGEYVVIYAMRGRFSILRLSEGTALYINTFDYDSVDDFVYYVLFALTQLDLIPSQVEINVWGTLSSHSGELKKLAAYVAKVEMGRRVCEAKLSYHFDELPESLFLGLQTA